jgi:hypothetical protein
MLGHRFPMFWRQRAAGVLAVALVISCALQAELVVGAEVHATGVVVPADGRLRGQDFAATVTRVSWPAQASVGGKTTEAPPGHRFVTFGLTVSEDLSALAPDGADPGVTAALHAGQGTIPLDLSALDLGTGGAQTQSGWTTGSASFVETVPNGTHAVDLVLSQGSSSQSFDLWTLQRVPPTDAVLYRDPSRPTLTATSAAPATLSLSNPADGFSDAASVSLQVATLSSFPPAGVNVVLTSSDAVLSVVLDGEAPDNPNDQTASGHYLGAQAPLPGSMLSFTPTGGTPLPATVSDAGDMTGKGTFDDGLFDATYSFVVPATLTSGTLSVNAGSFTGTEFTLFTAESGNTTLDVTAPASLALSFPVVPTAAAQKTPPWVGQPLPPTTTASASDSNATRPGHGLPIAVVVVVLLLLAAGVVLFQRRHPRRAILTPAGTARAAPRAPAKHAEATGTTNKEDPKIAGVPIPPAAGQTPQSVPGKVLGERPPGPMVLVLGPPAGQGLRQEPDRRIVIEILAWMVFHNDHPHSADEILVGVYPTEGTRDVNRDTFFTYLSKVRQCVGADHLPEATTAGGYRLIGVTSDWALFKELSDRADAAEGTEAIDFRTQALSLVRGVPFQGVPTGRYQWAIGEQLHSLMTSAVVTCAIRLANDLFDLGRYDDVEKAVAAGLRAEAEDTYLLELRQRTADARNEGLVRPGREIGDSDPADDDPGGAGAGGDPHAPGR